MKSPIVNRRRKSPRARCGFCGFAKHGTRKGLFRCAERAFKQARAMGIGWPEGKPIAGDLAGEHPRTISSSLAS